MISPWFLRDFSVIYEVKAYRDVTWFSTNFFTYNRFLSLSLNAMTENPAPCPNENNSFWIIGLYILKSIWFSFDEYFYHAKNCFGKGKYVLKKFMYFLGGMSGDSFDKIEG